MKVYQSLTTLPAIMILGASIGLSYAQDATKEKKSPHRASAVGKDLTTYLNINPCAHLSESQCQTIFQSSKQAAFGGGGSNVGGGNSSSYQVPPLPRDPIAILNRYNEESKRQSLPSQKAAALFQGLVKALEYSDNDGYLKTSIERAIRVAIIVEVNKTSHSDQIHEENADFLRNAYRYIIDNYTNLPDFSDVQNSNEQSREFIRRQFVNTLNAQIQFVVSNFLRVVTDESGNETAVVRPSGRIVFLLAQLTAVNLIEDIQSSEWSVLLSSVQGELVEFLDTITAYNMNANTFLLNDADAANFIYKNISKVQMAIHN